MKQKKIQKGTGVAHSTIVTSKSTKPNTYKEKIKDIVSDPDEIESEENLSDLIDDDMKKNEKSRISAQMTRKRRKIYIELLEKKVKNLTIDLESATTKLNETQSQSPNSEIMAQLHRERANLFAKLQQKIDEKDDMEIECTMDSLRLRLGLSGKTRNAALYSFFDEIVKLMMPFHMKYLIYLASENLEIFAQNEQQELQNNREFGSDSFSGGSTSQWFRDSGLSEKDISSMRSRILDAKVEYDGILNGLLALKSRMDSQNQFAQNFIDELRNFFPPINTAKFLIDLDKKRVSFEKSSGLYPDSVWASLKTKVLPTPSPNIRKSQVAHAAAAAATTVAGATMRIAPLERKIVFQKEKVIEVPFQRKANLITMIQEESELGKSMPCIPRLDSSQGSFSIGQIGGNEGCFSSAFLKLDELSTGNHSSKPLSQIRKSESFQINNNTNQNSSHNIHNKIEQFNGILQSQQSQQSEQQQTQQQQKQKNEQQQQQQQHQNYQQQHQNHQQQQQNYNDNKTYSQNQISNTSPNVDYYSNAENFNGLMLLRDGESQIDSFHGQNMIFSQQQQQISQSIPQTQEYYHHHQQQPQQSFLQNGHPSTYYVEGKQDFNLNNLSENECDQIGLVDSGPNGNFTFQYSHSSNINHNNNMNQQSNMSSSQSLKLINHGKIDYFSQSKLMQQATESTTDSQPR